MEKLESGIRSLNAGFGREMPGGLGGREDVRKDILQAGGGGAGSSKVEGCVGCMAGRMGAAHERWSSIR